MSVLVSLGIDISTRTGFAVTRFLPTAGEVKLVVQREVAPKSTGLQRCSDIAEAMLALLEAHEPDAVVLEGYGFANAHTLVPLVEIGTILRYFLRQTGYAFTEVAPNSLKKFVTADGKASKDQVTLHVYKRWGFTPTTNNTADAIGLAMIGLALAGAPVALIKPQHEVLSVLKKASAKKAA